MNKIPFWAGFALCLPATGCQLHSTYRELPQPLARIAYSEEADCSWQTSRLPDATAATQPAPRIPYGYRWNDYQGSDIEHDIYGDGQQTPLATSIPHRHQCPILTRLFGSCFAAPACPSCVSPPVGKNTVTSEGIGGETRKRWEQEATPPLPPPPVPTHMAIDPPVAAETTPTEPSPVEIAPTDPAPTEPIPVEPAPLEKSPAEPVPVESVPLESAPAEPKKIETVPVEPNPVEPAPAKPDPTPGPSDPPAIPPRNELPKKVLPKVESKVPTNSAPEAPQPAAQTPPPQSLIPPQLQPEASPPEVTIPRNELRENVIPAKPATSSLRRQKTN